MGQLTASPETDQFQDWVDTLSRPQVMALASQAGLPGALTSPFEKVRNAVGRSAEAFEIYQREVAE